MRLHRPTRVLSVKRRARHLAAHRSRRGELVATARSAAAHGNNLHPAIVSFAFALGDHTLELREREVHHTAVARAHGLERDDLTITHGLLAQAARHARQRVLTAAAVTVGIHAHVAPLDAGPVHRAVHDELKRGQHLTLLADDAPGVRTGDDDVNVVAIRVWPLEPDVTIHSHLLDHVRRERQGLPA